MMQNFGVEGSLTRAEWKWLLIGLRGFIDRFWQNKFPQKSRYGVQTRLRALLEPAIKETRFQKLRLEVIGLLPSLQAFAYLNEKCWSR